MPLTPNPFALHLARDTARHPAANAFRYKQGFGWGKRVPRRDGGSSNRVCGAPACSCTPFYSTTCWFHLHKGTQNFTP